jgi:hypothetical protein
LIFPVPHWSFASAGIPLITRETDCPKRLYTASPNRTQDSLGPRRRLPRGPPTCLQRSRRSHDGCPACRLTRHLRNVHVEDHLVVGAEY